MSTSTGGTTENQKTEVDPALKAMYIQNYADAGKVGQGITNYGPYDGQRVAGPTEAYNTGAGLLTSRARTLAADLPANSPGYTLGQSQDWLQESVRQPYQQVGAYSYDPSKYFMGGATVDPSQAATYTLDPRSIREQTNAVTPSKYIRDVNYQPVDRSLVRDVNAGEILPGMEKYGNAYTDAVIGQGTKDLDRARQIAQIQNGDAAVRTGSFGGGRHGVQEGETNRGFADATARLAAEERAKSFNVAAGLSGQDVSNKLAAGQANQGADVSMAGLYQQGGLQAGQANQQRDLAWAAQQLQGGQQAQAANQQMDFQTAMQKLNALNTTEGANADRRLDAWKTSAGYGQQAGLANMQAAIDAQKFQAQQFQGADTTNLGAYFQKMQQLMAASGQGQQLATQQYQMPMDAASKLMGLDQYSRSMTNEQIQAQMQAWDDERYRQLQALQLQGAALGTTIPNLGMSSTGKATTTQTPSGMQTLGQLAGVVGSFM